MNCYYKGSQRLDDGCFGFVVIFTKWSTHSRLKFSFCWPFTDGPCFLARNFVLTNSRLEKRTKKVPKNFQSVIKNVAFILASFSNSSKFRGCCANPCLQSCHFFSSGLLFCSFFGPVNCAKILHGFFFETKRLNLGKSLVMFCDRLLSFQSF